MKKGLLTVGAIVVGILLVLVIRAVILTVF